MHLSRHLALYCSRDLNRIMRIMKGDMEDMEGMTLKREGGEKGDEERKKTVMERAKKNPTPTKLGKWNRLRIARARVWG